MSRACCASSSSPRATSSPAGPSSAASSSHNRRKRELDLPLVTGDRLDPHVDRIAEPVGPPAPAPPQGGAERVQLVELPVKATGRQKALEHAPEPHEQAGADHPDDLSLPPRVPALFEEPALEQPCRADLVGQILDLRRLALALGHVLRQAFEVFRHGVVAQPELAEERPVDD